MGGEVVLPPQPTSWPHYVTSGLRLTMTADYVAGNASGPIPAGICGYIPYNMLGDLGPGGRVAGRGAAGG